MCLNFLIVPGMRIYQDLPGSIHEDIVMDGHRQGKKAYAYMSRTLRKV